MHTVIGILTLPNPASEAFHQKFGFSQASKLYLFSAITNVFLFTNNVIFAFYPFMHEVEVSLSKVGHLKEVGLKFGRWLDVGYFQKML